jgi:hypothetical protein
VTWLREAISDERKQADMDYVAIGALVLALVFTVNFLCAMSAISYARCSQVQEVGTKENTVRAFVPCSYDPNPLGIAIAACIAAFGSPIGALAGYMVATRRRETKPEPTTVTTAEATVTTTTQPTKRGK